MEKYCERCKKIKAFGAYGKQGICNDCCDEVAGNIPPTPKKLEEIELESYLNYEGSPEELLYGEGCTLSELLAEGIDPY